MSGPLRASLAQFPLRIFLRRYLSALHFCGDFFASLSAQIPLRAERNWTGSSPGHESTIYSRPLERALAQVPLSTSPCASRGCCLPASFARISFAQVCSDVAGPCRGHGSPHTFPSIAQVPLGKSPYCWRGVCLLANTEVRLCQALYGVVGPRSVWGSPPNVELNSQRMSIPTIKLDSPSTKNFLHISRQAFQH